MGADENVGDHSRLTSRVAIVTMLSGVGSTLAALFGPTKEWRWFSPAIPVVVSLAALVVGLAMLAYAYRTRALALVVSGMILTVTGSVYAGGIWLRPAGKTASPLMYPAVTIKFDPHPEPANFCSDFRGSGLIPEGFELMLFDRPSGDFSQGFAFHVKAEKHGDRWLKPDISLGDNPVPGPDNSVGLRIEIHAQLVDEALYNALISIVGVDAGGHRVKNGSWQMSSLPGVAEDIIEVTRGPGQGNGNC